MRKVQQTLIRFTYNPEEMSESDLITNIGNSLIAHCPYLLETEVVETGD